MGIVSEPRAQPLVLLVEDDSETYELISESLASAGYAVEGADDGIEVVERAKQLWPDLIVMDIGLPRLDGCEATRRLKRDPSTKHVPILILTGHVRTGWSERAHDAGCDGFLVKPCHIEELLEEIRRHLPSASRDGQQILIVEDDADLGSSLSHTLEDEGRSVALAENGAAAIRYLETHSPPRLILLDLTMPVMDGWRFRTLQESDPRWSAIPVIVLSGLTDRTRSAPVTNGILRKPVDLARLLKAVDQFLDP